MQLELFLVTRLPYTAAATMADNLQGVHPNIRLTATAES
jgi:hypothetical protein